MYIYGPPPEIYLLRFALQVHIVKTKNTRGHSQKQQAETSKNKNTRTFTKTEGSDKQTQKTQGHSQKQKAETSKNKKHKGIHQKKQVRS